MTLHISTLIEEFSVLPEQDSATMRLLSLLDDVDSEARDIARVIEADPSMTARLLTLSNSAFFAVRAPATNAWAAVMVVGFNVVRALAASGSLGLASPDGEMPSGFYEHSIASAAGASVVARHAGVRTSDAFSAGLLHDVGGALLFRANKTTWMESAVSDGTHAYTTLDAERSNFGASHDELGAQVLEYLHFPPSIVDIVRHHNRSAALAEQKLTRVVIAGIAFAETHGARSTTEPMADPQSALASVGIEFPGTREMVAEMDSEIDELQALLR